MDHQQFWSIIEAAKSASEGSCTRQAALVAQALQALSLEEIWQFKTILNEFRAESYRVDLWRAASLINRGCTDDGFEDFRGWLIAQGREIYEAALRDPDSLASLKAVTGRRPPPWERLECQDLLSAWAVAYVAVTGEELPSPSGPPVPLVLLGEHWDAEDTEELARRYPRLWAWYQEVTEVEE
jgi:Protein of unknown function (DUF4240)